MSGPRWGQGFVLLAAALVAAPISQAAQPQVPSLPSQPAGYVQYAITDLPNHYKTGPVAATNNTPLTNPLTDAGATLGRVLFYDKRLSHSNGVACAFVPSSAGRFLRPESI